jgi:site-specific DNA recombinase
MRVAFYVRVSTERQQQAQTIEQQVAQLRSYVAARDGRAVDEAHIFRDDGFSGGRLVRPCRDRRPGDVRAPGPVTPRARRGAGSART